MKAERDVIMDLLPAYFSGEASAATRTLVEEFFRENPDFEKSARSAGGALDALKAAAPRPDPEKEKLALERARLVVETRDSFLWLAIFFSVFPLVFRVQNHKLVWLLWEGTAVRGVVMVATAVFLWMLYFYLRRRKDPMPQRIKFLWMAAFYSLLPLLCTIKDHKIVWLFGKDPDVAFLIGGVAVVQWCLYFFHSWKTKHIRT